MIIARDLTIMGQTKINFKSYCLARMRSVNWIYIKERYTCLFKRRPSWLQATTIFQVSASFDTKSVLNQWPCAVSRSSERRAFTEFFFVGRGGGGPWLIALPCVLHREEIVSGGILKPWPVCPKRHCIFTKVSSSKNFLAFSF